MAVRIYVLLARRTLSGGGVSSLVTPMTRRRLLAVVGATALAAIVAVIVIAIAGGFSSSNNAHGDGQTPAANIVHGIYQREGRSVYFVQASGAQGQGGGTGTAWLYDNNGDLVTNEHVISGSTDVALRVGENELVPVKVVGEDASTDIAVLRADPKALRNTHPLELANASEIFVGQPVVAIGNPFGLEGTITTGIVSAKSRVLEAPNGFPITNVVQTDAAINPGNSGGPLVDLDGKVIGVNSQIATGGAGQSAGLGFAVPVDTVERVAKQLIDHGRVDRANLGVSTVAVTPQLAQQLGLNVQSGALVLQVAPGSPAANAGLRGAGADAASGAIVPGGDVITKIDGQNVGGPTDIAHIIGQKQSGDTAQVTYVRGGNEHTVSVKLASQSG
jgi:S1-C subfamily serine protease